jgi:hypothetical protein
MMVLLLFSGKKKIQKKGKKKHFAGGKKSKTAGKWPL